MHDATQSKCFNVSSFVALVNLILVCFHHVFFIHAILIITPVAYLESFLDHA